MDRRVWTVKAYSYTQRSTLDYAVAHYLTQHIDSSVSLIKNHQFKTVKTVSQIIMNMKELHCSNRIKAKRNQLWWCPWTSRCCRAS
jgi:hypothetical protein